MIKNLFSRINLNVTCLSVRNLFLISFSILFLEMACIRWFNATVMVLAYFNNLVLVSCFFGLGVGCLLAKKKIPLIQYAPVVFLFSVVAVILLSSFNIHISYTDDVIFADNADFYQTGLLRVPLSAFFGFIINLLLFVLIGQELGRQINAVENPLKAYAYDIAGSFCGVVAYTVLAWLQTPPFLWYLLGFIVVIYFLKGRLFILVNTLIVLLAVYLISSNNHGATWSPYYKIEVNPYHNPENKNLGYMIMVDNLRIQDALNFVPEILKSSLSGWISYYQLPYKIIKPKKVLIMGAGSGNEAVVALMNKVEEVHAVEIDPVIASYGKKLHPNRPYLNPKVKIFVDDARSFLSKTKERYDLIVMSALDSHKQVGGMSSIRLESYVYTKESYEKIKSLLNPGGVFILNLSSPRPWVNERMFWTLTEALGKQPTVFSTPNSPFSSVAFTYGPDDVLQKAWDSKRLINIAPYKTKNENVKLATDNWPYLYLEKNQIPEFILYVLIAIVIVCVLIVYFVEPSIRNPNFHFFFLGAGFMLLEARSVTQMALLFGSTWIVNSIVFAAILLTILIANQMVYKQIAPSNKIAYVLLFVTLIIGYFFPFKLLLEFDYLPRLVAAIFTIGLPIIWASFIFSNSFKSAKNLNVVFGSNLLGVVFGGCAEYFSNVLGMASLYLIATALYALSLLLKRDS